MAGKRRRPAAPTREYVDQEGNVLTLRGSLSAGSRQAFARTLSGAGSKAAATPEDNLHRAEELLFERLAVRWEIAGAPIDRQRELLQRFRWASQAERAFVRHSLREHCAQHFPDVKLP